MDPQASLLIVLELLLLVAFALVASSLWRAYRLAKSKSLRHLSLGFLLLGLAQVGAAGLEFLVQQDPEVTTDVFDRLDALFWLYYAGFAAGLVLVFLSFGRRPFQLSAAYLPWLVWAFPIGQLVLAALLFLVVLHAGFNHISRARPGSLQTAGGFFLILLGHFLNMIDLSAVRPEMFPPDLFRPSALNPQNLVGTGAMLAGALLLYLAVARPRETS